MLTGATPFGNSTVAALLEGHLSARIPRLPPSSAALQPLVDGLLAKDPNERFQSADDVLDGVDCYAARVSEARFACTRVVVRSRLNPVASSWDCTIGCPADTPEPTLPVPGFMQPLVPIRVVAIAFRSKRYAAEYLSGFCGA